MLVFGLAGLGALVASTFAITPKSIGPIGVTVWFLILLLVAADLVACSLFRLKLKIPRIQNTAEKLLQNSWRQGWLIGGVIVAVLALSSLRQLTWRDAGLILAVMLLVEVFLRSRA